MHFIMDTKLYLEHADIITRICDHPGTPVARLTTRTNATVYIRVLKMFSAKASKIYGLCSVSSNMRVALHEKSAGE